MKKNYLYIYIDMCCGEQMSDYFSFFKENLISDDDFIKLYKLQGVEYDLLVFDLVRGVRIR